jgi:AcrR family transcriptional regulator
MPNGKQSIPLLERNAMHTESSRPAVGRPRDRNADEAILSAAFAAIMESGYARMSIEGVAARAGVGKTTIYRRYASKQELAAAALIHFANVETLPDLGDTRAEIETVVGLFVEMFQRARVARMMGTLLAEEATDPELLHVFRERVIWPRRKLLRGLLERGQHRGEVRADLDIEVTIDFIASVAIGRYLAKGELDEAWSASVVDSIWRMIRA